MTSRILPLAALVLLPLLPLRAANDQPDFGGLDLKKFRERVTQEGMKGGGKLHADPETFKKWFVEFGMKEDRVKPMNAEDVAALVGKVFASKAAPATGGGEAISETELAGLNLEKFRKCIVDEALKNNGKLEATTEHIAKWLQDCGMQEEHVKAMSPADLAGFVQKALGSSAGVQTKG